jgi:hypothetical protein
VALSVAEKEGDIDYTCIGVALLFCGQSWLDTKVGRKQSAPISDIFVRT